MNRTGTIDSNSTSRWGFLTGRKHLNPNVAAAIQDEYGQFIVDCINSINTGAEA